MALPSSGTIKMSQVRDELKKTGPISLGNSDVRKLGGKPSGTIKMSDLYGKSTIPDGFIEYKLTIERNEELLQFNVIAYGLSCEFSNRTYGSIIPSKYEGYNIINCSAMTDVNGTYYTFSVQLSKKINSDIASDYLTSLKSVEMYIAEIGEIISMTNDGGLWYYQLKTSHDDLKGIKFFNFFQQHFNKTVNICLRYNK